VLSRYPRMRAGKNRIARINAKNASNEIATIRNGKDTSHTKGRRTMAKMAKGQHNTNSRHHPINKIMVFTEVSNHFLDITLSYTQAGALPGRAGTVLGRMSSIWRSGPAIAVNHRHVEARIIPRHFE
jgi:hypothetical protein